MAKKKSYTIGFICPHFSGWYFDLLTKGIIYACKEKSINLRIFVGGSYTKSTSGIDYKSVVYDLVESQKLDAIIIQSVKRMRQIKELIKKTDNSFFKKIPIVAISVPQNKYPYITIENKLSMKMIIDHLIEVHNYKKIAFLGGPENNNEMLERFAAYKESLASHNIEYDERYYVAGTLYIRSAQNALEQLLDQRKLDIDAIACVNDEMAFGVLTELSRRGIKVPKDIAVTGFDDVVLSSSTFPPLTTVNQPVFDQGREAVLLAHECAKSSSNKRKHIVMESKLIIRESCGCSKRSINFSIKEIDTERKKLKYDKQLLKKIVKGSILKEENIEKLYRSFIDNLNNPNDLNIFYKAYREIVFVYDISNQKLSEWTRIVSDIFKLYRDQIKNSEIFVNIEDQISILNDEIKQYISLNSAMFSRVKNWEMNSLLEEIGQILNMESLFEAIISEFNKIGIQCFYLVMYESENYGLPRNSVPTKYSRLHIGYNGEKLVQYRSGIRFKTEELVPEKEFKFLSHNIFHLHPIDINNTHYGYVLYEYREDISHNISLVNNRIFDTFNAIKQLRVTEESKRKLDFVNKNLENIITERTKDLELEIIERKEVENSLLNAQEYISNIINSMPSLIIGVNRDLIITQWNLEAERRSGLNSNEALGMKLSKKLLDINFDTNLIVESIKSKEVRRLTDISRYNNEIAIYENITIYPLNNRESDSAVVRIDDVTKQHNMQEQLLHSNKMDAIGQLAAGVAHDFNNKLTGILGAAQILKLPVSGIDEKLQKHLDMIIKASREAADLTSKLLKFGHKSKISNTIISLNKIIDDSVSILCKTVGRCIDITYTDRANNSNIIGDSSSIQNMIMNLVINASHAINDSGSILIKTKNIKLSKEYCSTSSFNLHSGEYLSIIISDNGIGISEKNLSRIFEPFYSTKGIGNGTGLGLSTVYSTVTDYSGEIVVNSTLGKGTTFIVNLPTTTKKAEHNEPKKQIVHGNGTILLVDDEEIVIETVAHMIEQFGYEVITATNGKEGIELYLEYKKEIDLIISDIVMPGMGGLDLLQKIKQIDPKQKFILASGFSHEERAGELENLQLDGYIEKPYHIIELSRLISDVINS